MDSVMTLVLALVGALFSGGGIAAVFTYLLTKDKQKNQSDLEMLPHSIARIKALEDREQKCQEDRARDQLTLGALQESVKRIQNDRALIETVVDARDKMLKELLEQKQYQHTSTHDMRSGFQGVTGTLTALRLVADKLLEKLNQVQVAPTTIMMQSPPNQGATP